MWSEIAIASGFVGFNGLILKWFNTRINKMESNRKKEMYQPTGQTTYVTRAECDHRENMFCNKIEDVKNLILAINKKREHTKDEHHEGQRLIGERLAAIEAKLL